MVRARHKPAIRKVMLVDKTHLLLLQVFAQSVRVAAGHDADVRRQFLVLHKAVYNQALAVRHAITMR